MNCFSSVLIDGLYFISWPSNKAFIVSLYKHVCFKICSLLQILYMYAADGPTAIALAIRDTRYCAWAPARGALAPPLSGI